MDTAFRDQAERIAQAARANSSRYQLLDKIEYPSGIRMAVNFTLDFDAMLLRRVLNEPVPQRAHGEFGGRVGIWRLIELFDKHRVKATIFTPGRICELYPDSLKAAPWTQLSLSGVEPESAAVTNAMIEEFNERHGTDIKPAITGLPFRKR